MREPLEADVALVRPFAGVRAIVYLEVLLAGEGGRALQALERPALHCGRIDSLADGRRGPPSSPATRTLYDTQSIH